ncbi:Crp/Fnr family transcriptional regulator [Methylobacillus sp. MM3]|uniref:Crp/Fnr family transcriptional regulator n=1 Tax=Methylobacillus sp. MM3 TaxID=1848039 RepID=UPI0007DE64B4|nr:Crp/Fnr family transcriptional regulator [Methylobacillus sp. MM3]OAJ71914.1 Crp/Fnr family transcriptional regulator [Methylobacillus sp. MM3]
MGQLNIIQLLPRFHLFSALDSEQLTYVANETQHLTVPRGGIVFNRGDTAHSLFMLISGQVKLAVNSPQGTEKVIGIIGPGESFGEAIIFLDQASFPIYAQATTDSQLLLIPKQVIFNLLERDMTVSRKMLAGLSVRNRQLVQDIESVALLTSTQRLIGYLLQISAGSNVTSRVTLPASKTMIASLLNLTPETLSRTMLKLQQQGMIEVNGKEITIIDLPALREYGTLG